MMMEKERQEEGRKQVHPKKIQSWLGIAFLDSASSATALHVWHCIRVDFIELVDIYP